jgi:hypothetical protein
LVPVFGCVTERLMVAPDGAVFVDGGAENVRPPRLPELPPPPVRASAELAATTATAKAPAQSTPIKRLSRIAISSRNPKKRGELLQHYIVLVGRCC